MGRSSRSLAESEARTSPPLRSSMFKRHRARDAFMRRWSAPSWVGGSSFTKRSSETRMTEPVGGAAKWRCERFRQASAVEARDERHNETDRNAKLWRVSLGQSKTH